ncbi:MAG: DUF1624 domain-containing protein [Candidatus Kapabacteria bacterium]|nr:DUF1624 domain-containing protein [Candidatus Kapabacteria bacterium]
MAAILPDVSMLLMEYCSPSKIPSLSSRHAAAPIYHYRYDHRGRDPTCPLPYRLLASTHRTQSRGALIMAATQRFAFLDAARGIAVLWMIQVHVTNVILDPQLRQSMFFNILNLSNGYVAPTFIFCAGAGLWIALSRRGTKYLEFGPELMTYLRRLSFVLFCAYLLHAPIYSLGQMLHAPASTWMKWAQLDVLHVIVYASLAALGVFLVLRDLSRATIAYGVIAAIIFSISWMVPKSELSQFPLLPWSGYLFTGAAVTGWFMQTSDRDRLARLFIVMGLVGPVVLFLNLLYGPSMPWDGFWWRSPEGLLFRVFATLLLLGILYRWESSIPTTRVGRFLVTLGNESLFMYVGHLLIVYGSLAPWMDNVLGTHEVGYGLTFLIWVLVSAVFSALMLAWHGLKRDKPDVAAKIIRLTVIAIVIYFIHKR